MPESRDDYPERASNEPEETIIDVSGEQPRVVPRERPDDSMYIPTSVSEARIYVAQGGTRACLVPLGLILLLVCCACATAWVLVDNLF